MSENDLNTYKRLAQGMYEQYKRAYKENDELKKLVEINNVASTIYLPHRVFTEQKARDDELARLRTEVEELKKKPSRVVEQRKFMDLKKQLEADLAQQKDVTQQIHDQYSDLATRYNTVVKYCNELRASVNEAEMRYTEAAGFVEKLATEEKKTLALRGQVTTLQQYLSRLEEDLAGESEERVRLYEENAVLVAQNDYLQNINRVMTILQQENLTLKYYQIKYQNEITTKTIRLYELYDIQARDVQRLSQTDPPRHKAKDPYSPGLFYERLPEQQRDINSRLRDMANELAAIKDFARVLKENVHGRVLSNFDLVMTSFGKLAIQACNMYDMLYKHISEPFDYDFCDDGGDIILYGADNCISEPPFSTDPRESSMLHGVAPRKTSRISRIAHLQRDSPAALQPVCPEDVSQDASQATWLYYVCGQIQLFYQFAEQYQLRSAGALRVLSKQCVDVDIYDINQIISLANALTDEYLIVLETIDELLARQR